jgi:hypothetical protein
MSSVVKRLTSCCARSSSAGWKHCSVWVCSWSQVANLLFIESPAGVGFSYCAEGLPCNNNDESTADDTEEFFRVFYKAWPEYKGRDLYITGESYAGVRTAPALWFDSCIYDTSFA